MAKEALKRFLFSPGFFGGMTGVIMGEIFFSTNPSAWNGLTRLILVLSLLYLIELFAFWIAMKIKSRQKEKTPD